MKLRRRFGFHLKPKAPYNFALTVRKPAGWPLFTPYEVYGRETLWSALYANGALLGIKLRNRGSVTSPSLFIEVFMKETPGRIKDIREGLAEKLGANQDLRDFYRMARKDPVLRHAVKDLYGLHDTDASSLFAEATLAILLQMAPLKRSQQMWDCVIKNYGEAAEFDGKSILLWPAPEKIAPLSPGALRRRCKLGYRAKSLVGTARVLSRGGFPSLEELKAVPPGEARRRLLELPGIGDYSADIIGPYPGFPIDAWSAEVFSILFWGRAPERNREAIERVKAEGIRRWGRHCWMAFLYVVHDLGNLSNKLGVELRAF